MTEVVGQTTEINRLIEKLGKNKVRAIAALGIAAAGFLGISGKPESGVGAGVEVPDFRTGGNNVTVGVMVSSSENEYPLGLPKIPGEEYGKLDWYTVNVGGAKLSVYAATVENKLGAGRTVLGIYPGFETQLGKAK